MNSARIELLDNPRLIAQLCSLERRTSRGGKDSIDHGPGGHDDVINAAAGALTKVLGQSTHVFLELDESIHNLDRYINPADEHRWIAFQKPLKKISDLVSTYATTAFIQMGIDFDGNFFALEEYYCGSNRLIKDHAFEIRNLRARYENEHCILDPGEEEKAVLNSSGLSSIQLAYAREKVPAILAQRTATDVGIDLIREYLRLDPEKKNPFTDEPGSPRLFISRQRCPNLWQEMTALRHENADGRSRYIGADFAVSGLRHVLMSRPSAPKKVVRKPVNFGHQYGPNSWMGI